MKWKVSLSISLKESEVAELKEIARALAQNFQLKKVSPGQVISILLQMRKFAGKNIPFEIRYSKLTREFYVVEKQIQEVVR